MLERERGNLIEKAIRCQETMLKLKAMYNKYPKEEDLVKKIYTDTGFADMMKTASKTGVLQKQGGANVKNWASRHFVLNDCFLLYVARLLLIPKREKGERRKNIEDGEALRRERRE